MPLFPVRLYVNGHQIGDNATFSEAGETVEQVAENSRAYFLSEGYAQVETEIAELPRWSHTNPEPTVIVRCTR